MKLLIQQSICLKKGCRYSNNYWYVYKKSIDIESIYNILVTSYDKKFAFEVFLEKIKEFGAEILSQTELKEKFIICEDYEKVRIYIKPKENKDEESKNSKSLDELLNKMKIYMKKIMMKLKQL